MKTILHTLVCVLIICTLVIGIPLCLSGCSTNEGVPPKKLPVRFVQVEESKICDDYQLDMQEYHTDGTKKSNDNDMCYLVDRVSRYVYIYMSNSGKYDSGVTMLPCLDKDGNHMRYDGTLPE